MTHFHLSFIQITAWNDCGFDPFWYLLLLLLLWKSNSIDWVPISQETFATHELEPHWKRAYFMPILDSICQCHLYKWTTALNAHNHSCKQSCFVHSVWNTSRRSSHREARIDTFAIVLRTENKKSGKKGKWWKKRHHRKLLAIRFLLLRFNSIEKIFFQWPGDHFHFINPSITSQKHLPYFVIFP